jgi:hypothetical protein
MLTAMARELVTQKGVGEKADALWKEIQQQHFGLPATRQRRRNRACRQTRQTSSWKHLPLTLSKIQ